MSFFLTLLILLMLFNNPIGRIIPTNLLDEIIFVLLFIIVFILLIFKKAKLDVNNFHILVCLMLILLIGIISTIYFRFQTGLIPIFKDVFMLLKMPLTFIASYMIFKNFSDVQRQKVKQYLLKAIKVISIIIFVFGLINLFFDIGMECDVRNGIKSYQFIFTHATFLVYTLVIFVCVLFTQKKFSFFILLNLLSILMTMRDKGYFFIIVYFFLLIVSYIKAKKNKLVFSIASILGAIILVYAISFDKLNDMYLVYGTTTARGALYVYGLNYAIDFFPLGTGFATWGSSVAGEYYSILYYENSMNFIPGINPYDLAYATDTYWPYIYTQFGFIGLFLYLWVIFLIFRISYYSTSLKCNRLGILLIFSYSIIACFFEGFFVNDSGVFTMLIINIIFIKGGCINESTNLLQQK